MIRNSFAFLKVIKKPEDESCVTFYFRQFKCFPSFVHDEDEGKPSFCICYPFLIFAWDNEADINSIGRYEFSLAIANKETKTLSLNKFHPEGNVAYDFYGTSQKETKVCDSLLDNYQGMLPQLTTTCPKELQEWRSIIQYASNKLYVPIPTYPKIFYGGLEPSNFGIFAWAKPKIITDRWSIHSILGERLLPKETITPPAKRKVSLKLRRSILERDKYKCVDCGRSPANDESCILHVDHRQPLAKRGTNNATNLQTLCDWCNLGKGVNLDWKL